MILSYRQTTYDVPHTSKCIIHTKGTIRDGDMISVTSPIFASINFISGAINASEAFSVKARILIPNKDSVNNDLPDESFTGTLVCDDNDVFNMYVKIQQ